MEIPDTYFELVIAYGAIWFCTVFFVIKLMFDQKKMDSELNKLIESSEQSL